MFAARLLADAGRKVRVLERAPALAPTPRSLIVTNRVRTIVRDAADAATINRISRFELFANGRVASLQLQRPDLIIERSILIDVLARDAATSGAEFDLGTRFVDLDAGGARATIRTKRGQTEEELEVRSIVGADGANSRVATCAGWAPQPTVPLLQAIVELPEDMAPDTTRVWFRPEDTPYFYWLIPESDCRGALGVIGESRAQIRVRLDAFLESKGLKALEYQAAQIPAYRSWVDVHKRIRNGDVYLVGDAAGHVKVSTVGGIVTGFRGAKAVAELITQGASAELRALKRELRLHLYIRRAIHAFTQDDYARLLDQVNAPVAESLGAYTRDDAGKVLLALCRSRPQMLLYGLRSLITSSR